MKRGRGCLIAALLAPVAALAEDMPALPSGQAVELHEVLSEPGGLYRYRFVAPGLADIAGDLPELTDDIDTLCRDLALPALEEADPEVRRIVISLSAEPVEFGVARPGILQVFEAYSVEGDACIWEPF
ncbi:DUF6497 family protein [Roseivivax sediminis]|uniref:DUF6497 family protein n=1 Tax=Roseivivax sediminis TaxID=936889 RepID=UPI003743E025